MFRTRECISATRNGFPRIRGDVPLRKPSRKSLQKFSPHTRGCSHQMMLPGGFFAVFPAYAGMFRLQSTRSHHFFGFPRIRGDVPIFCCYQLVKILFSPHTRGCSSGFRFGVIYQPVFPAYAGMFLRQTVNVNSVTLFSPHTRGCSAVS